MYSVYVEDDLLYSPDLANDGYTILSPKVNFETNKTGSFTFLLPPQNPAYDNIKKLVSMITIWDNDDEIFRGRVLHDEKDFYNRKKVYCEGELSFLIDSVVRPYEFSGDVATLFNQFISNHNSQVEAAKQFTVGNVTVTDPNNYIVRASAQYPKTWDELNEKFLNLLGGYIRTRKEGTTRYIDYIKDYGHISNQVIEFGVNMLDISEYISADEVFTCLIPLGKQDDEGNYLTIASVNDGKDYLIDEDAVKLFGYVWKTEKWDDVTIASNLKTKGDEVLKLGIELAVSLSMKAVDLHLLNVDTDRIAVGDMVRVISIPHKIDRYFLCSKITLDLVNPDKSEYTFGFSFTTMTEKTLHDSSNAQSVTVAAMETVQKAQNAVNDAKQTVEDTKQIIVEIPTEYVKTKVFEEYKQEVNRKISTVYRIKGSVANYATLPIFNQEIGDVWNVLDTGANYVWTDSGWDKLSETIELTEYMKTETFENFRNEINSKVSSVYHFKGSVSDYDSLPVTNEIGDVYNLLDTGANYAWTSTGWDKLSETIDLSKFVESSAFNDLLARVKTLEENMKGI